MPMNFLRKRYKKVNLHTFANEELRAYECIFTMLILRKDNSTKTFTESTNCYNAKLSKKNIETHQHSD